MKLGDRVIFRGPTAWRSYEDVLSLVGQTGRITAIEADGEDTVWTVWFGGDRLVRCHEDELQPFNVWWG